MNLRKRDKAMITDSSRWPRFPYLPLIRRENGKVESGLLVYDTVDKDVKPVVLLANLFLPDNEKRQGGFLSYQNFDYLLDDAWVVD